MTQEARRPIQAGITQDRTSGVPATWQTDVAKLLDQQIGLCRQLDTLSVRQSEVVKSGDTEALLRVLSERQAVVDGISKLSGQLEPLRDRWDERLDRLADQERAALRARVSQLGDLIDRIDKRDEADRAALEAQREVVSNEMRGVMRGKGAAAAYGRKADAAQGARFQDHRG